VLDSGLIPLLLALLLDLACGDPPNRYHPVAWMGAGIGVARRLVPRQGRWRPCVYGAVMLLAGVGLVGVLGMLVEEVLQLLPRLLYWLAEASILKTTFALRGLTHAAQQIQVALQTGDVDSARRLLSWHLVSRDTAQLTPSQVAAATVESVAENASDGVIAPLLYYVLGGLPAALAYRFINTADAMLGYRDPEREWLGKVPARVDDLVNLVPARLTAGLLLLATQLLGGPTRRAGQIWYRDARQTASPNAGQPMSVMAGAIGVELEKVGHYCLGAGQALPHAQDIATAIRLVSWAVMLAIGLLAMVQLLVALIQWLVVSEQPGLYSVLSTQSSALT
jgi:adenosylcobinamide-phosphate synthase